MQTKKNKQKHKLFMTTINDRVIKIEFVRIRKWKLFLEINRGHYEHFFFDLPNAKFQRSKSINQICKDSEGEERIAETFSMISMIAIERIRLDGRKMTRN